MEKSRLRPKVLAGPAFALSVGFLVSCAEPLTPETAGMMDGRTFATEHGFCPPPWRNEAGVLNEERLNRTYSGGGYDSPETFQVVDRYWTNFDIGCESHLIMPRSDV